MQLFTEFIVLAARSMSPFFCRHLRSAILQSCEAPVLPTVTMSTIQQRFVVDGFDDLTHSQHRGVRTNFYFVQAQSDFSDRAITRFSMAKIGGLRWRFSDSSRTSFQWRLEL